MFDERNVWSMLQGIVLLLKQKVGLSIDHALADSPHFNLPDNELADLMPPLSLEKNADRINNMLLQR